MAQQRTFTKMLGMAMAGAMLLAACGGGDSDSRTRNVALEQSDCWVTQQAKDEFLKALGARVEQAAQAAAGLAVAEENYLNDAKTAQTLYDEWRAIGFVVGHQLHTDYRAAKLRHAENYDVWQALQKQANQLPWLNDQVSKESNKPLCSEQTTSQETTESTTEAPSTSTATQGGNTGSLGIGDIWCNSSYVMRGSLKVGETTTAGIIKCGNLEGVITVPEGLSSVPSQTDREFVWTLQALVPGTHKIEMFHIDPATSEIGFKQSYTIEVTGEATNTSAAPPTTSVASPPTTSTIDTAACDLPVPREGQNFVVDKGDEIDLTFTMCRAGTGIATDSEKWADTDFTGYSNDGVTTLYRIRFPNAGTARLHFFVQDMNTNQLLTGAAIVTVTVRDPSATDPCEGKAPEGSWNPDLEGGSATATSTCDGIDTVKVVIDRVVGVASTQVFTGYVRSGLSHTDLIQCFGEGTYRVYMRHVTRASVDDEWTTLGDVGLLDVTYTPPRDATVSNGAAPLPTAVFEPTVTEAPTNPRDASPSVPVVAIPAESPVMICDQACIDSLLTRVGATSGVVEISFGNADFEKITAGGSLLTPPSATSVRVRVTPTNGEPVTMAAVMTRDSVDQAYADVAMEEVKTELPNMVTDEGSSFPWWIALLVVALLAVAGAEVRRRKVKAGPADV